jgi:putative ABC transport system permease protein
VNWLETVRTGWAAIASHRLRSMLTMLGILIGIAAVVLTVGLGLGSQQEVGARISSLGSNLLIVTPGSTTSTAGVRGGAGSASTLTVSDAEALASPVAAPDIAAVAAVKNSSLALTAGSANWTTTVVGTSPSWLGVRARTVASGRFLTDDDDANEAAVTVLGPSTATELFGSTDVVGRSVTINGVDFTIVGVLESAGSDATANLDDQALVPLSTSANRLVGGTNRSAVSTIYLQTASTDQLSAAYQEAQALLLNLHHITTSSADFTIANQESLLATATSVSRTLTILLTGVAALSLLVGGIGVMNIMLVSVTERTREIGLRKALGAPPGAIRRQFLVEAVVLGLGGGILGAALGIACALVLPGVVGSTIVISPLALVGALVIAIGIGIVFGVYPATRAARLAPIDALRSE